MVQVRSAVALAVVALCGGVACSGGGGGSTQSAKPYVGGTARAAAANAADRDSGDRFVAAASNDDAAHAQPLPGVVTLGGWVGATAYRDDAADWFRAPLVAGQAVTLTIADWAGASPDLDLRVYAAADPTTVVTSSESADAVESVRVLAAGEYLVEVLRFAGSSNYTLTLGQGSASAGAAAEPPDTDAEFVPGEVIVTFRDGLVAAAGADSLEARAAAVGLTARAGAPGREMLMELGVGAARARAFATLGIPEADPAPTAAALVDVIEREKRDTARVVQALRARADVATADLNYLRYAAAVPNDEFYKHQWHYPLMKLPQAWDVTTGTPATGDVVVAVVDTGVLLAHPDLTGQLLPGYDFISDPVAARDGGGPDTDPNDPGTSPSAGQSSWHGTHVAGTIAARTNDGTGVAGVSWGAKILPVRVLGLNGSGTSFDILQGVRWAAGLIDAAGRPAAGGVPRAKIINLSLGGLGNSTTEQALYTQLHDSKGVVVVAASGNNGKNELFYPASYAGVISVSATDLLGQRAPYSNASAQVDVAAPGGDMTADLDSNGFPDGVLSLVGNDSAGGPVKFDYWFMNGTSMASPHMAGVVALMRAVCPTMTPAQLDALLAGGTITTDLGAAERDDVFGNGLIDALAAVQAAQTTCSAPVTTTLDVTPQRLDFQPAPATTVLSLRVKKSGTGALPAAVTATDTAAWLTVTSASVDAEGLGTWTARVTRPTAAGVYSATITFTSGALSAVVPVTLQVGATGTASSDAGHIYLLLLDQTLTPVDQVDTGATAGAYPYAFQEPGAGPFYIVAGTDSDDDGAICDAGESCGAYPSLTQPAPVDGSQSPHDLDFLVGFGASLGGASAGAGAQPGLAVPPQGFRLLRPAKRAEVPR